MIDLKGVGVTYSNGWRALSNVQLKIDKGEFVFVVGTTGAGKSTLLKLLSREETATEGTVKVSGQDLSSLPLHDLPAYRRKIGIVFQDFGLLPNKTVYENVAFALQVTGASRQTIRRQVPYVLDLVAMSHRPDAFPNQLSGGEQQRVAIARALVNEPFLLLADEPTGNLDPETSLGIIQLLNHINLRGTTVIIATHDQAVVDFLQRRVIAFEQGGLVRDEVVGNYRATEAQEETS
ncbi:cell division ATP-binding protein FtsE [Armatimonadota bacterium]|nr:cell division ATP-binding protein FtsE [Armatimonadota bacterium]